MNDLIKSLTIPIAIICIACMQMYSMSKGHDGIILVTCIAVISGLAGYRIPGLINLVKSKAKKE